MELTAANVQTILEDCLFKDDEVPAGQSSEERELWAKDNAAVGRGIMRSFAFNRERIAAHAADIESMLEQLDDQFRAGGGGGWSFLNMCVRKDGEQWGEHPSMEALACLAEASGIGGFIMRDMASVMPGGMPYFQWKPIAASTTDARAAK